MRIARTLAACAGAAVAATSPAFAAGPVLNIFDAAAEVRTLVEQTGPRAASVFALEDLNNDGVTDVLVSYQNGGRYAAVLSPVDGATLLTLESGELGAVYHPYTAARMINDINNDGVRDIAVGGRGMRVFSGADGAMLRDLVNPQPNLSPWGLSFAAYDDVNNDGVEDLLVGHGFSNSGAPLLVWTPATGQTTALNIQTGGVYSGYSLVDLGIGASGTREYHYTAYSPQGGDPTYWVRRLGGQPLQVLDETQVNSHEVTFGNSYDGAVVSNDFNADGFPEVILGGFYDANPGTNESVGLPIVDGADGGQFSYLPPVGGRAPISVGDITGDGFPDLALVQGRDTMASAAAERGLTPPELVYVRCGRTGQRIALYELATENEFNRLTSSITPNFDNRARRDSIASPGDINGDGANDLIVLTHRGATFFSVSGDLLLVTLHLPTPCPGDTDFDRAVDFADLNAVLSSFGAHDITSPADLNASGTVDFADLNLVLSAFGSTCD